MKWLYDFKSNFDRKRTFLKQGLGKFDIRDIDDLVQVQYPYC